MFLFSPGYIVIGHFEFREQDGAVLGSPAVYHRDDFVSPAHRPHQSEVLYRTLHGLHRVTVRNRQWIGAMAMGMKIARAKKLWQGLCKSNKKLWYGR